MKNSQNATTEERGAGSVCATAEETLRLIARLPAPEGLEQRVQTRLSAAPRRARILHWPGKGLMAGEMAGSWMRGAAAAAIVTVVAGGGWGIYARVQTAQPGRELAMPAQAGPSAGFSSAGAKRTPESLASPAPLTQGKAESAAAKKAAPGAKRVGSTRHTAKGGGSESNPR